MAPAPRILFVASELYPYVKTGGLADVCGVLPVALRALGFDVRLLVPGYPPMLAASEALYGELRRGVTPAGVPMYVLDRPALYDRPGNPYLGPDGLDWPDNHLRFAALSRAAACFHDPLDDADGVGGWTPDIVHGHDWQAGLTPAYLEWGSGHSGMRTVMTIHNLAFQGLFPATVLGEVGLPPESYAVDGVEYWGKVGFLKAGLFYADRLTTVSPTYAQQIQTPDGGMGLDGLLRTRTGDLVGILNGVDEAEWNPATDPRLDRRYDSNSLDAKAANKAALRAELGLEARSDAPLFVVVSRLTVQKGLDLVLSSLGHLLARGGQLAVLGSGDAVLEDGYRAAAAANPGRVAVRFGYDEDFSHRLQGGGDVILVPSRFEPCGLTQMYGLRYGTLPLVRRTGGLADTVADATPQALAAGTATGFVFDAAANWALNATLDRVFDLFPDRDTWRRIQRRAMAQDVGWTASAKRYAALYADLLAAPPPRTGPRLSPASATPSA
ncbi:MAG TPA: glycogen synthase GlgA [Stellaceae bacterium]|jgi:starch synthase